MVDIAPEDHHASNWKTWLEDGEGNFNEEELPWYGTTDESPSYGRNIPSAAQTEAARRFVSHWLNEDNHGFIIPGNEWGVSLKHWLNVLVARPAEDGRVPDPSTAPTLGQPELPQPEPEATEPAEPEDAPKFITLVEQVSSREMKPWRWVDLLAWEYDDFLEWGYDRNDIDEALELARKLSAEDDRAEQAKAAKETDR